MGVEKIEPFKESPAQTLAPFDEIGLFVTRSISYRARNSVLALAFILALSPVWFFWSLGAAFTLIKAIGMALAAGTAIPEFYDLLVFFYLFLIALGIFAVFVCLDTSIRFDDKTIRLPCRFLFEMRGRLRRPWSSLVMVDLRHGRGEDQNVQYIKMVFDGGAAVTLSAAGLKGESLRELIFAVQLFSPGVQFLPSLSQLPADMTGGMAAVFGKPRHISYTRLWEDELAERFGSTIFVPLEPGALLRSGKIKVRAQLGFGGLSAVYLAEEQSGETVVLKEAVLPLSCDQQLKEKAVQMFEREASILATLDHERIASVRDYFVEKGRHYIVLDHIEGVDLRRFVQEHGPQSPATVWRWLNELTDILAYLHGHAPPVVHRDITPDNILLSRDGHLRLIDFGAANNLMGTATGTLVGKQAYISPEQFRGKAGVQSDLYSLGATLYFLITGLDPEPLTRLSLPRQGYLSASADEQLHSHLSAIINDLTAQNISDRTAGSAELKDLLQKSNGLAVG